MKYSSLAARYRPQTFAEVAGQEMVTTVLSRAAAQDRVAPAYLLSGTRGVGKTTIARILAKALNCEHAPGPEPCNQCDQCRKITQGCHVDVTEIDGASNNSVEDARALRETIGYAPMEGRYKVFIIDEAHMLSQSAFNALLKTLEEPPPRVVFIFATTEAHKFPITIVSRCQHFVFKRLPEAALRAHLTRVLTAEGIPFEERAVSLLARRAAGSVRDSMSLLGQTLALSDNRLTLTNTQQVLGLAGQDFFVRLLDALANQDCVAVTGLVRELLDQGVDIGFFLRELVSLWRTLFLLRQAGDAVLPVLELSEDEARQWKAQAPRFSAAHIHAAWQMVLDTQRRVIQSPEPAAALELLLLQLALLPRLLPLERLSSSEIFGTTGVTEHMATGSQALAASPSPSVGTPAAPKAMPKRRVDPDGGSTAGKGDAQASSLPADNGVAQPAGTVKEDAPAVQRTLTPPSVLEGQSDMAVATAETSASASVPAAPQRPQRTSAQPPSRPAAEEPPLPDDAVFVPSDSDRLLEEASFQPVATRSRRAARFPRKTLSSQAASSPAAVPAGENSNDPNADGIQRYCDCCLREHGLPARLLRQVKPVLEDGQIHFRPDGVLLRTQLMEHLRELEQAACACFGPDTHVRIHAPQRILKTNAELKEDFASREELQACQDVLEATLVEVRPV